MTHVDDILHAGTSSFDKDVMNPLKQVFQFGSEEEDSFRYIGMNIQQCNDHIRVDQNHYVQALDIPSLDEIRNVNEDELMDADGQTEFRSLVAKILQVGYQSRPDVCFEAKALSTFYGKATRKQFKLVIKKMIKLKTDTTEMVLPDIGDISEWGLVAHGDAGIKSMPDN